MRLHLVRHGHATAAGWGPDGERPLSRTGRSEARRAGRALRALGVEPDLVLTSPLLRARETADEIRTVLAGTPAPVVTPILGPGASAPSLLDEIRLVHPEAAEVVCTGHMPDLGYIAAHLGAGPGSGPFRVETGSLVRLDLDGAESRLVWFLPPAAVRGLAGGS